MEEMMEAIKEYLRFHHDVIWAPLLYAIRNTIKVQSYNHYPSYATPDHKKIARMLHLPSDNNKMHNQQSGLC